MVVADRCSERTRFAAGLALATLAPLGVAPLVAPTGGRGIVEAVGAVVVVAYAGHIAVTGWLWSAPDVRRLVQDRPWRLVAVPLCLVAIGAVVPTVASAHTLGWLLMGFFVWQFTHFQRQNLGLVAAVAARWEQAPLSELERRVVAAAGWCAAVALVARPRLVGVSQLLPPIAARPLLWVAVVGLAACVVVGAVASCRSMRPPAVTAAFLVAVVFVAPVFVFDVPAAAVTGMVVAHGLQYLWIVGCRSAASSRARRGWLAGWWSAAAVLTLAVVGGAALTAMSELHPADGVVARLLYGLYFGIVMAHFAVDGVVWRRSPVPRRTAARRTAARRTAARRWPLVPSHALGGR